MGLPLRVGFFVARICAMPKGSGQDLPDEGGTQTFSQEKVE